MFWGLHVGVCAIGEFSNNRWAILHLQVLLAEVGVRDGALADVEVLHQRDGREDRADAAAPLAADGRLRGDEVELARVDRVGLALLGEHLVRRRTLDEGVERGERLFALDVGRGLVGEVFRAGAARDGEGGGEGEQQGVAGARHGGPSVQSMCQRWQPPGRADFGVPGAAHGGRVANGVTTAPGRRWRLPSPGGGWPTRRGVDSASRASVRVARGALRCAAAAAR